MGRRRRRDGDLPASLPALCLLPACLLPNSKILYAYFAYFIYPLATPLLSYPLSYSLSCNFFLPMPSPHPLLHATYYMDISYHYCNLFNGFLSLKRKAIKEHSQNKQSHVPLEYISLLKYHSFLYFQREGYFCVSTQNRMFLIPRSLKVVTRKYHPQPIALLLFPFLHILPCD